MKKEGFAARYGPWALVTGAARGLGAEFSRQVAGRGLDVVLVDRIEDGLRQVAEEIEADYGRRTSKVVADLSREDSLDIIRERTEDLDIGLLISNAGVSIVGPFLEVSLEDNLSALYVNARVPLMLAHEFGRGMVERGRGGIILVSSASALQGTAYTANYAATKAYNLILGESLWEELRGDGVDVLGFMPGATWTPGYRESSPRLDRVPRMKVMEAGVTVREALDALGEGPCHIAGRRNRWNAFMTGRMMPRKRAVMLVGKVMRNCYGKDEKGGSR
ncbi:MAG: SDR family NAD(P)-dependent oxidoreductase [Dehalococcoidia bacterium]